MYIKYFKILVIGYVIFKIIIFILIVSSQASVTWKNPHRGGLKFCVCGKYVNPIIW